MVRGRRTRVQRQTRVRRQDEAAYGQLPTPGSYWTPWSRAQKALALPWLMTLVGPGSPATELIDPFDVGGTQNTAAPTGKSVLATPVASIGSRKHGRFLVIEQVPLSGLLAVQSALIEHARIPLPSALTRPSQVLSDGPLLQIPVTPSGSAVQMLSLHAFGWGA